VSESDSGRRIKGEEGETETEGSRGKLLQDEMTRYGSWDERDQVIWGEGGDQDIAFDQQPRIK